MYTSIRDCQRVDGDKIDWHSSAMQTNPLWLIANWKMNGDAARARAYAFAVNAALDELPVSVACVFCPPAPYLLSAYEALSQNARLAIGAQNCHMADKGAHTGEVSAPMLADSGAKFVILGHSERRAAGETDANVRAKAQVALATGLIPVICVGESRAAYESKQTNVMLDGQLAVLKELPAGSYLIAYEPVWAIGGSTTPQMSEISAAHSHIKTVLGSSASVLYGGSVNAGNVAQILALPEVAGALVGGASLEIESMVALLTQAATLQGNR
jgi:triosephosphate isomerase